MDQHNPCMSALSIPASCSQEAIGATTSERAKQCALWAHMEKGSGANPPVAHLPYVFVILQKVKTWVPPLLAASNESFACYFASQHQNCRTKEGGCLPQPCYASWQGALCCRTRLFQQSSMMADHCSNWSKTLHLISSAKILHNKEVHADISWDIIPATTSSRASLGRGSYSRFCWVHTWESPVSPGLPPQPHPSLLGHGNWK